MAQDWSADVKKYAPEADDGIVAGIVRHCGISLHKVDSALVSFSDKAETDRVRDGFCRKKLALTQDNAEIDRVIATVGERMKADRTKNRVTVYYLLAEAFDKLQLFAKAPAPTKAAASDTGSGAAAAAVLGAGTHAALGAAGPGATGAASPLLVKKGAARAPDPIVVDDAAPFAHPVPVAAPEPVREATPVADPDPVAAPDPVAEPVAKAAPRFGTATAAAGAVAAGLGAVGGSTMNSEPLDTPSLAADLPPATASVDPVTPPVSRREQYISAPDAVEVAEGGGGSMKWLPWLLLGLGVLALLWYFLI